MWICTKSSYRYIQGLSYIQILGKKQPLFAKNPTHLTAITSTIHVMPIFCCCKNSSTQHIAPKDGFEKQSRRRLFSSSPKKVQSIEDVASYIKSESTKKIVVMTGAGISTPSGIPDFRTPGTGLYDNVHKYNLPYPEAIFDIEYFDVEPKPFFTLAKELYPSGKYRPNVCHYFLRLLHEKKILHRIYTQNIDGFERMAGLPEEKLVEAHGTFSTAKCRVCFKDYKGGDIVKEIFQDKIPRCKRELCNGVIKPDIVFFGEQLPTRFYSFLKDMPQADLLIVMGTSLEVQPFAGIAETVLPGVPRILFNMEAAGPFADRPRKNDIVVAGDLVTTVTHFCDLLGWKEELFELVNQNEETVGDKRSD